MSVSISCTDNGTKKDSSGWYQEFRIRLAISQDGESNYYAPVLLVNVQQGIDTENYRWFSRPDWFWIQAGGSHTFVVKFRPDLENYYYYYCVYAAYSSDGTGGGYYTGDDPTSESWFYWEIPINLLTWSWSNSSGSWNDQHGSASSVLLQSALSAVGNNGRTDSFSFSVWNDLVNWIIYNLQQLDISITYYNYVFMSSTDKILTADRWNELRKLYNAVISEIGGTYLNSVSRGDIVYGSYFINLVNNMNTAINNY